jgi:hypothetical protein
LLVVGAPIGVFITEPCADTVVFEEAMLAEELAATGGSRSLRATDKLDPGNGLTACLAFSREERGRAYRSDSSGCCRLM